MAIKTATIQVRMGLESELDISKALPGEWLLSTDTKHIRMCVAYGIVLRMATYESFEADMAKIKELVSTAQSLKDIVMRLASEVGSKTTIVLEATEEAKKYMEEAKKYSELAFATTPEGYEVLVKDVDLLKNSIIQTTDRTLYGSKVGGIKLIGVKGASEQKQYSGAQLLNYEAWKGTAVENGIGVYENNGIKITATKNDAYTYHGSIPEDAIIQVSEGDIVTMSWDSDANDNNNGAVYLFGVGVSNKWGYATTGKLSYIVPSGVTQVTYRFGVANAGDTISYKNIMINKGDAALPWEPFVGNAPSPSPSYPQPIESVGDSGSLVINTVGKNLLEISTLETQTVNGVTFTNNGDGTYTLNGTATGEMGFYLFSEAHQYPIEAQSTYRFVGRPINGISSGKVQLDVRTVEHLSSDSTGLGNNFTSNETKLRYVRIYVFEGAVLNNAVFKPMLVNLTKSPEFANVVYDDFSPYHSNTITIPLSEPLRGIGDIKDEVVCKDGVWGVLRRIKSVVFDGSSDEVWYFNAEYNNRAYIELFDSSNSAYTVNDSVCSHFTYNETVYGDTKDEVGFVKSGNLLFRLGSTSEINTLDLWKAWLAENPITVDYILATPVFEPFTDQTPFYGMQSYDTVTYISTDSKVEPSIEVKFGKTEGDAITLGNYNRTKLNEIRISELMALQTELAAALVAGSEG